MKYIPTLARLALTGLLAVIIALGHASASETPDLTSQVDELFADWTGDDRPGAAVAVIRDGEIVYQNGFGMADLERNVPITLESAFEIGSISKQFTAMCILLLEHDGKLALDDDIRTYIPEMPEYEQPITLRHLLHHTSGIRDIETLVPLAGLPWVNYYSIDEQLDLIARQNRLNFAPNSEYLYSNSGYLILAIIVDRVSGQSIGEFAEERIFAPLGMSHSVFWDHPEQIVADRAIAYSPREDSGWGMEMWNLPFAGPAGLYTTVGDLALWDANFYDNKLGGGAALIEKMETPGVLESGESINYAAGLVVASFRGLPTVRHGGAWMGYRASVMRFPEQHLTVAVLSNAASMNVGAGGLADELESSQGALPPFEPPTTVELPADQLAVHQGTYWNETDSLLRTIELRDGKLHYARGGGNTTELGALRTGEFIMLGPSVRVDVTFRASTETEPRTMTVSVEGEDSLLFVPLESPSADDLSDIAGIYWSTELQRELRLQIEDGQILASWTDETHQASTLQIGPDELLIRRFVPVPWSPQDVRLQLDRYDSGRVSGLTLSCEMVRGVLFAKQQ